LWTEETFLKKAELFKVLMEIKWKFADRDARMINSILEEYGIKRGKILDLMCGNGRIAINLAKLGHYVVGIDFSEPFIRDAERRAVKNGAHNKTRFLIWDIRELNRLSLGTLFDAALLVWSSLGYYDPETDIQVLKNIRKFVKKQGVLIICDVLLRDNFDNTDSFMFYVYKNYHIYSKCMLNKDSSTITKSWTFFILDSDGKERYLDEIKMRLILYSIDELTEMLKNAGWSSILVKNIEGIINIIARNDKKENED